MLQEQPEDEIKKKLGIITQVVTQLVTRRNSNDNLDMKVSSVVKELLKYQEEQL